MYQNPRRLRRPEERVGTFTNADLPPPDEAGFRELHDRYYPAMLRVARSFVRSPEEAEEVIQETWIAALSGIDRFEGRSSFRTWLFRILVNRARTRGKRESRMVPFSTLASDDAEYRYYEQTTSPAANPEEAVLDGELRGLLESAVAQLPRMQQLVISMRDIEGWSADEVCAALELSPANQRVLLHRARMKVRQQLRPYVQARGTLATT
jgi:RNA polymerase sigma-70 factor (ECF subfamily)